MKKKNEIHVESNTIYTTTVRMRNAAGWIAWMSHCNSRVEYRSFFLCLSLSLYFPDFIAEIMDPYLS